MKVLCLSAIALLTAMSTAAQSVDAAVVGKVVNSVTGQPVSRVDLTLRPERGTPRSMVSDAQGNFRFDHVKPGKYTLDGFRDGYGSHRYGATVDGGIGRSFVVTADKDVLGLQFRMFPRALLQGRVLNREGEPVPGVTVAAGSIDEFGGGPTMEPGPNMTDDRGEFRIPNVPSGIWVIQAVPPPVTGLRPSDEVSLSRLPTYYPSAGSAASAQPIFLSPGQEATGIQITLREGPVYRIRGRLTGSIPNVALRDLELLLVPDPAEAVPGFAGTINYTQALSRRSGGARAIRDDGTFELRGVERGTYRLYAAPAALRGPGPYGSVPVTVREEDLTGVMLPLGNLVDLDWTVKLEEGSLEGVACWFMLNSLDGDVVLQSQQTSVGADGRFRQTALLPGTYYVTFHCTPPELFVRSIRLKGAVGQVDGIDGGLDLRGVSNTAAVDVVLSAKSGEVHGVTKNGDEPAPGKWVALFPEPSARAKSPQFRFATSDEEGRFSLTGVAPGEYRLYVWPRATNASVSGDPRLLKRLENQAVKVTVREGQRVEISAPVLRP